MKTWDDNEFPLAYLITFRTYGTWLHGDVRTSVDRFMNQYRGPRIPKRPGRESYNKLIMNRDPVTFSRHQIVVVTNTIIEVCEFRNWKHRESNVRTNHVHVVISGAGREPGRITNALKAYSTRRLREAGLWDLDTSPWADKGSERWLWDQDSVNRACDYVIDGQGPGLTAFDNWETLKNPPADAGGSACE